MLLYMKVLVTQSCLTLCNSMDCTTPPHPRLPGSSVHGILQARILEWVAIPFSRGSSWPRDQTHISWVSYIVRQVPLPLAPPGKLIILREGPSQTSPSHRDASPTCNPEALSYQSPSSLPKNLTNVLILLLSLLAFPVLLISAIA